MYAIAITTLQEHLRDCWRIVDEGEHKAEVIAWLRSGGHRIDDHAARLVADLIERGERLV